jgi:hypothetical protein
MRLLIPLAVLSLVLAFSASRSTEAPTGFDNKSNGVADDATHQADLAKFEEVEQLSDGLGPLYTRSPAGNATRVRFQVPPPKSRNYAWAIRGQRGTSSIRKSRLLTELK